ncbi:M20 family metallopeptidase [Halorussus litoreus]|uniref:M20 family metallopeptidase n=1 Tax=Halorussus litoreus TaxID=1710536 RepID=UPI000E247596|nr:M20/M25/M40 family metallo-hydrolase [Halorussus litoreus]
MTLTERERAVVADGSDWIDAHADELFDLLDELVARSALSGEEGVHTDPDSPTGYLWEFLDERGDAIEVDVQPIADDYVDAPRENVYATLGPSRDDHRDGLGDAEGGLVCASHTDVVPAGEHADWPGGNPFSVTEGRVRHLDGTTVELDVGGKVHEREIRDKMARVWNKRAFDETEALVGRGVFDNKASSACLVGSLLALDAALAGRSIDLRGHLVHGHLVDEEVYQTGVKRMVGWNGGDDWFGDRYDPDGFAGVVLEGSYGFVPVVGHRGLLWVELEATGESAHASTPELGRNAVTGLSEALAAAGDGGAAEELGELFVTDDYLGDLTTAPGTTVVGGGVESVDPETRTVERSGLNSIPDWAEATFDLRVPRWQEFPDGAAEITDRVCERVEAMAADAAPEVEFEARVPERNYFPPAALGDGLDEAREHPLVETARAVTRSTFGYEPGVEIAPGVTDAAFLYHGTRMPTLVEYGPAGGLSHEALEYVERDQIVEGAKAMLELAVRQVGVGPGEATEESGDD